MSVQALHDHLASGLTHVCQCWAIKRGDGVVFGFTDHDRPLTFGGVVFVADSGMTARALSSTTGLSVDNTEALGVLTDDAVTEADIGAGRYDQAEVTVWQVCWDDVTARQVRFRGTMGEITRNGASFQVDLRGLAEALNQPQGRSYLKRCSAVLGDRSCAINSKTDAAYVAEVEVDRATDGQSFHVATLVPFNADWFKNGFLEVLTGAAKGLSATIKRDELVGTRRTLRLWQPLGIGVAVGDQMRLVAGCDKRAETCREKFANLANFQGFPHIPGDDWLMAVPRSGDANDGGSLL
jgi:uncharacterized phage protein (TIGR02218 family)